MNAYFIEIFGATAGPVVGLAATIAIIAIALWLGWILLRRFRSGLFISGGNKGKLPRLAVTDAVPVDSHRRLILVRRDDVEHLIMIGGPADIVVESGIGKSNGSAQQAVVAPPARLPVQTAPIPAAPPAQRPAMMAARDAVSEAERGRPVRGNEAIVSDRRAEPSLNPTPPPFPRLPASNPASDIGAKSPSDLDMDSLINDLQLNPAKDR